MGRPLRRNRRDLQVSAWRVLDMIEHAARGAGEDQIVAWMHRNWQDLVPVVNRWLERRGVNVGTNACGTGVLPVHSEEYLARIRPDTAELRPLDEYDKVIIGFSGGKDSIVCALVMAERLRDLGLDPAERMELWHHHVDGGPDDRRVFDWPCTAAYCIAVAEHLGIPLLHQWREGGIATWATREPGTVAPEVVFQTPTRNGVKLVRTEPSRSYVTNGELAQGAIRRTKRKAQGGEASDVVVMDYPLTLAQQRYATSQTPSGKVRWTPDMAADFPPPLFTEHKGYLAFHPTYLNARRAFPQTSGDLNVRWCSSKVKIEVGDRTLNNDPRFRGAKVLMVTGERRQEGSARATYATVNKIKKTRTEEFTQYRPVLDCTEQQVWDVMRRYGIVPHPCYWVGFSRCSCMTCIFLNADEFATVQALDPSRTALLTRMEIALGTTIKRSGKTIDELCMEGSSQLLPDTRQWQRIALSDSYDAPVYVPPSQWRYPQGAFRGGSGPT